VALKQISSNTAPVSYSMLIATVALIAVVFVAWRWLVLGSDVSSSLVRGQFTRAVDFLESDIADEETVASTKLANLYFLGLGVEQDYERAAELYSRAAFAGDVSAQVNLGHIYKLGRGVKENKELAYAWFNLARGQGSDNAQLYMSELLADHEVRAPIIPSLRRKYATINNFPKLH